MSTIICTVSCPYCHKQQATEVTQIQEHLDFTGDLDNDAVDVPDTVVDCIQCDRRFVLSGDLNIMVYEFAIVGEAEKPSGSGPAVSPGLP